MTKEQAQLRAKKLVKFYSSVFIFLVVNVFLYILDFYSDQRINWAFWVTLGWGLGIIIQAINVYYGTELEEKITKNLLDKNPE